jgi:hypothetical protein
MRLRPSKTIEVAIAERFISSCDARTAMSIDRREKTTCTRIPPSAGVTDETFSGEER